MFAKKQIVMPRLKPVSQIRFPFDYLPSHRELSNPTQMTGRRGAGECKRIPPLTRSTSPTVTF
jgi:hypothetical protein